MISSYFLDLFTSSCGLNNNVENIVKDALLPCISDDINQSLIAEPSTKEIKEAVFDIHPGKAPGPNGFSACFFHSNWEAIDSTILKEIQGFFSFGFMPLNLNETHIRLILKGQGPTEVVVYRLRFATFTTRISLSYSLAGYNPFFP